MALTPLHSLRLVVGECNVVGRRSFRGTWELTPPNPDWAESRCRGGADAQGMAPTCLWVRGPAIRAPDDGHTDWFAGGADRATRVLVRIRRRRNPRRQGSSAALRLDEPVVGLRSPVAVELPDRSHLVDHAEVEVRDQEFVFVL